MGVGEGAEGTGESDRIREKRDRFRRGDRLGARMGITGMRE